MNHFLDNFLDTLLGWLGFVYGERWVVPFVLVPLMLTGAAVVHAYAIRQTNPYLAAARRRVAALRQSLGTEVNSVSERKAFSENYLDVSTELGKGGPGADALVQAWHEFQESLVDEDASPIRNTSRPGAFFSRAAPKQTTLAFWSNIFVGLGLILTFLGLIVALNTASKGMAGGTVSDAKQALTGLLTVAGAKFFTSVAGLVCSIWLRFAEQNLAKKVNRESDAICNLLERGLLYVPQQRIAVDQLEVLKEQRDQLKFFNTDVALQLSERIGAQFQTALAPVSASLSQLNASMISVTQGIGDGAKEAIEKVSGEQLRGLSETLATLGQRVEGISHAVGSSGEEAARQIRVAGSDFAQAAADIRAAFDSLASRVDGLGKTFSEQSGTTLQAHESLLSGVMTGLERLQAQSASALETAVRSLQSASTAAATTMQQEVAAALTAGVTQSQQTFQAALEAAGQPLQDTAGELTRAFGEAAKQVESAGTSFRQSSENAIKTADAMGQVAVHAKTVSVSMNDAAGGFANAAAPVSLAAQSIEAAVRRLESKGESDAAALRTLGELSAGIRATQESAETAWHDYRLRFEGVDEALGNTVQKLAASLAESLGEFRRFSQQFDSEIASAVSKLSNSVTAIQDYAESLDDYAASLTTTREAAE